MAILKHRCLFWSQATTADVYAQALGENHVGGRGIFVPSADGPFQDLRELKNQELMVSWNTKKG